MCSTRSALRSNRGFMLIELLLAVAILGVVAAFIFVSLSATTGALETVRASGRDEQLLRSAITVLTNDLTLSQNPTSSPWLGQNRLLEGQPADSLAFVTTHRPTITPQARQSDQSRVVYTRIGPRLIRYVRPNLLTLTEEGVERTELLDNLLGFNVRYYDGQAKVWVERWDGRVTKVLPQAFMIEFLFDQGPQQLPKVITTWLTLPT
ncbi:MAG: type II secretion system protein GspJ [Nitrospiraceae bacterium]